MTNRPVSWRWLAAPPYQWTTLCPHWRSVRVAGSMSSWARRSWIEWPISVGVMVSRSRQARTQKVSGSDCCVFCLWLPMPLRTRCKVLEAVVRTGRDCWPRFLAALVVVFRCSLVPDMYTTCPCSKSSGSRLPLADGGAFCRVCCLAPKCAWHIQVQFKSLRLNRKT